ncbi:beta strand repeat-containing protein [Wenyingzhuangia sp. IMCC45533]
MKKILLFLTLIVLGTINGYSQNCAITILRTDDRLDLKAFNIKEIGQSFKACETGFINTILVQSSSSPTSINGNIVLREGNGKFGRQISTTKTWNTFGQFYNFKPNKSDGFFVRKDRIYTFIMTSNSNFDTTVGFQKDAYADGSSINIGTDLNFQVAITKDESVFFVNQAPTFEFDAGTEFNILENSGNRSIPNFIDQISDGDDSVTQNLTFTTSNNNESLFEVQPTISSSGTLNFTSAENRTGSATINVTLTDDGGTANNGTNSITKAFTLNIFPATKITSISEDTGDSNTDFITNDNTLTVNGTAIPNSTIAFNVNGTEVPSVLASATTNSSGEFSYTIPQILPDGMANLIAIAETDNLTTSSIAQVITIDTTLPQGFVTTINETFESVDIIKIRVNFNEDVTFGNDLESLFNLTNATFVNFEEGFSLDIEGPGVDLPDLNNNEDNDEFDESNDNGFESVGEFTPKVNKISSTNNTTEYTLTIRPTSLFQNISIALNSGVITDKAGNTNTATEAVTITSDVVNNAPSFDFRTEGKDLAFNENTGARTIENYLINIDDGDANEIQTVTFNLTNNNNNLFSVQPTISNIGTLTFEPAQNTFGEATVTISALDDGPSTGNSANASISQTFTITINPVNNVQPVITNITDDSGESSTDFITKNTSFTINGTAKPTSIVGLRLNNTNGSSFPIPGFSAITDNDGNWSITTPNNIAVFLEGETLISAESVINGTQRNESDVITLNIDTITPTLVSITRLQDETTNATFVNWQLVFSEPVFNSTESSVDFGVSGVLNEALSSSRVTGRGTNTLIIGSPNVEDKDGILNLVVNSSQQIKDIAGNVLTNLTPSGANQTSYTLDYTSPRVTYQSTVSSTTNASVIPVSVTISEAIQQTLTVDDLQPNSNYTISNFVMVSNTSYTFDVTPNVDDESISVAFDGSNIIDLAGNRVIPSRFSVFISAINNVKPMITSISQDTGSNDGDYITTDTSLTIRGVAKPNSAISLSINDVAISESILSATANRSGNWLITLPETTANEQNTLIVHSFLNGISLSSDPQTITIDNTAPTFTVVSSPLNYTVATDIEIELSFSEVSNISRFTDASQFIITNATFVSFAEINTDPIIPIGDPIDGRDDDDDDDDEGGPIRGGDSFNFESKIKQESIINNSSKKFKLVVSPVGTGVVTIGVKANTFRDLAGNNNLEMISLLTIAPESTLSNHIVKSDDDVAFGNINNSLVITSKNSISNVLIFDVRGNLITEHKDLNQLEFKVDLKLNTVYIAVVKTTIGLSQHKFVLK